MKVEWQFGERKIDGEFIATSEVSPYLIPMGEDIPQRWIYSRAKVLLWLKGDVNHIPQKIEGLDVFPFMAMENGHHHGTSYDFQWSEEGEAYELSHVAFHAMRGCWSLNWRIAGEDSSGNESKLMDLMEYKNLSPEENSMYGDFCKDTDSGGHGDHGHH